MRDVSGELVTVAVLYFLFMCDERFLLVNSCFGGTRKPVETETDFTLF